MSKFTRFFILALFVLNACTIEKTKNRFGILVTKLETTTDASLRGLCVVNENVVWASGSKGTVLRSTDAGLSWSRFELPFAKENDFRSIHAWNEKRAIVFGVAGPDFGYLTADGGKSWNVVYNNKTQGLFFNSLKFADEKNGLAVSDPVDGKPFIIKTTDGGHNWNRVLSIPKSIAGEANFAASNTCIEFLPSGKAWMVTGGNSARVFKSTDSGKSWEVVETPIISGNAASGIFSVSFADKKRGVIMGGTYNKPEQNKNIAAYTINGGITWLLPEVMPKEYRSCVQFVKNGKKEIAIALGKTGFDYSSDYGKSWHHISKTAYYTFRAIPGKSYGFAAGANGKIDKIRFKN